MFNMKLKAKALLLCTALVAAVTTNAQTPVYLFRGINGVVSLSTNA